MLSFFKQRRKNMLENVYLEFNDNFSGYHEPDYKKNNELLTKLENYKLINNFNLFSNLVNLLPNCIIFVWSETPSDDFDLFDVQFDEDEWETYEDYLLACSNNKYASILFYVNPNCFMTFCGSNADIAFSLLLKQLKKINEIRFID
jgi:hypothetical protein